MYRSAIAAGLSDSAKPGIVADWSSAMLTRNRNGSAIRRANRARISRSPASWAAETSSHDAAATSSRRND